MLMADDVQRSAAAMELLMLYRNTQKQNEVIANHVYHMHYY